MHLPARFIALYAAVLASAASPAMSQAPSPRPPVSPQRRFVADSFWTLVWSRGFSREEELFIEPRIINLASKLLFVVDLGTREVVAFDPATGKSRLQLRARNGAGPGEIRRPAAVVPAPGGYAISDQGNGRVSAFDLAGRLLWDTPLPEPVIGGLCIDATNRILIKRYSSNVIETRDTSGALLEKRTLPWVTRENETLSSGVQIAGPSLRGECAIIREFGGQFAVASVTGAIRSFPYVEPMSEPEVTSSSRILEKTEKGFVRQSSHRTTSNQSGMNAMIRGDTLIVRFGGDSNHRIFVLDYYLLTTGKYLHSRMLPRQGAFVALTVDANGTFYGAEIGPEHSGVVALRPSRVPPPQKSPGKTDSAKTKR